MLVLFVCLFVAPSGFSLVPLFIGNLFSLSLFTFFFIDVRDRSVRDQVLVHLLEHIHFSAQRPWFKSQSPSCRMEVSQKVVSGVSLSLCFSASLCSHPNIDQTFKDFLKSERENERFTALLRHLGSFPPNPPPHSASGSQDLELGFLRC